MDNSYNLAGKKANLWDYKKAFKLIDLKYGTDSEVANKLLTKHKESLKHEITQEEKAHGHIHSRDFNRRVHRLSAEGVTQ